LHATTDQKAFVVRPVREAGIASLEAAKSLGWQSADFRWRGTEPEFEQPL
jgi:hypothetical protein